MAAPDFETATRSDVAQWAESFVTVAKWLLDDLKITHRRTADFWPRGINERPDMEFAAQYDEETVNYVHGITVCMCYAREAIAELQIRSRPN